MSHVIGAPHRRGSGAPPSIRPFAPDHGRTGADATDEVVGSSASVVCRQGGDRLHAVAALLVAALGR